MSKNHRGSGLRDQPAHGRGICARCGKENIKVLYEQEIEGKKVKICKFCKATLKNIAKKTAKTAKSAEAVPETTEAAE
ncbi:MAG: hypothetical protein LKF96_00610 [Treponema sp.]|jgi:hypothetical protein|nr:hypothetical protein [Treponema sp.]